MKQACILWIALVALVANVVTGTKPASHGGDDSYSTYIKDSALSTFDWLAGNSENCPFQDNTMDSIRENLERHIKGQNEGLNTILSAISGWEFQRESGQSEPLVLALTGPTGVGKSETAFRIAEGALAKKRKVGKTLKYLPNGLLTLRGEDYTGGDFNTIQESIRNRIIDHLEYCGGNAVIVFDEVQKVMPGTLEVLMPALETRGSLSRTVQVPVESASAYAAASNNGAHSATASLGALLSYTASATTGAMQYVGKSLMSSSSTASKDSTANTAATRTVTTTHSTENAIFLFISDIGAEKMMKLVLSYGNRSAIPQSLLRNEIKGALDEQWSRLRFGKVVREVVPYLPLEPEHIREILKSKLDNLKDDFKYSHWRDLVVDEDVVGYLSGPPLVKYSIYNTKNVRKVRTEAEGECGVDGSGDAGTCSSAGSGADSAPVSTTKIFATWGARSLENAGPLQDLKGAINRYAQPWRPDQILHVGLVTEANREKRNQKWGTQDKPGSGGGAAGAAASGAGAGRGPPKQIYIQWCKVPTAKSSHDKHAPHDDMHDSPSHHSHSHSDSGHADSMHGAHEAHVINDEVAFSSACETKWFGPLVT